ncbi:MAG: hypothetical protein RL095_2315 [Verrucomicrobiota bacterium]|jgi:formiminoglutamase
MESTPWQGRRDDDPAGSTRRWHEAVTALREDAEPGLAILGFACDAGVRRNLGRPGAAGAPDEIRKALAKLPLHDGLPRLEAGDISCQGDGLEEAQEAFARAVGKLLAAGHFPLGLGGGHEIAWASFQGLARHLEGGPTPKIGIVNFDAHFDLRAGEPGNSGTPFRQIAEDCSRRGWPFAYACMGVSRYANTAALYARARQFGVLWREDERLSLAELPAAKMELEAFLAGVDSVYLTVCLDVLPLSLVPGVSAPAPRGVGLEVLEPLLDLVMGSGKVRLADIAELNPDYDIDGHSARVAARLAARIAERVCLGRTS